MRRGGRRLALIAAALLLALALSITAFAEFTKSYRAKRVIAAYAAEGMLFSSNYLQPGAELYFSTIYLDRSDAEDESQTAFDATVTVCNYAQGNPTRYYGRAISYTLTASVVRLVTDGEGNLATETVTSGVPAVLIDGSAMQSSYAGSLAAGAPRENVYTLSLPRTMLTGEKLYVQLTATPAGGYADLEAISALFDVAVRPETSSVTWHIEPTDARGNDVDDYAGYNFRLSGSGKGTVVLGWNAAELDVSEVFKSAVSASAASAGELPAGCTDGIRFSVDADDVNSYDIQFYMHEKGVIPAWANVSVQMTFTEDVSGAGEPEP